MSYGNYNNGGGYGNNSSPAGGYMGQQGGYGQQGGGRSNQQLGASLAQNKCDFTNLPPMIKTEYTPSEETLKETQGQVDQWREEHNITMYGDNVPLPILNFNDFHGIPEAITKCFKEQGYTAPTPIQSQTWPILLSGRDLVGVAKTGSGKTMAFMVPGVMHILAQNPWQAGDGPNLLVLAPTRELACQIEEESKKVIKHGLDIYTTVLYGGTPKGFQARALRQGVNVVIATPGRLIDLLEMKATNLLRVTYLVLDEADRMLDMGFEPQLRAICTQIRPDRQTLMFSATWPKEIRAMAASFQKDFVRICIGSEELHCNKDVTQHISVVRYHDKLQRVLDIIKEHGAKRYLIFTKTKKTADELFQSMMEYRLPQYSMVIHGDKPQQHRDSCLDRFRRDPTSILIATDVACRGLDIKDLDVVINHCMPSNIEDYVHRVGRTGRAGKKGDAYSFLGNELPKFLKDMRFLLMRSGVDVPECLDKLAGPMRGRHGPIGYANNYGGAGRGYGGVHLHGKPDQRSYSGSPVASGAPNFPVSPVAAAYTPSDSKRKRDDGAADDANSRPPQPKAKPAYVKNVRMTFGDDSD